MRLCSAAVKLDSRTVSGIAGPGLTQEQIAFFALKYDKR